MEGASSSSTSKANEAVRQSRIRAKERDERDKAEHEMSTKTKQKQDTAISGAFAKTDVMRQMTSGISQADPAAANNPNMRGMQQNLGILNEARSNVYDPDRDRDKPWTELKPKFEAWKQSHLGGAEAGAAGQMSGSLFNNSSFKQKRMN